MNRILSVFVGLALAASAPIAAGAAPRFFVGVLDDGAILGSAGSIVQDLGLKGTMLPVWWNPGETVLDPAHLGKVEAALTALPPGGRLVVAVDSWGDNAPVDAKDRDQYCEAVRDMLARYPTINDVVIWNEPNKSTFWKPQFNPDGTSAAPTAYVALLARCWDVLHAFRPGVNVIAPATSPRGNDNPYGAGNISHSPVTFIRKMAAAYRASGRPQRIFDTVAHHVYGVDSLEPPSKQHAGTWIAQGDWEKLMRAYTEGFKGTGQAVPGECRGGCVWIWYTEAGYQTSPDDGKLSSYTGTENTPVMPDHVGPEPAFASALPGDLAFARSTQLGAESGYETPDHAQSERAPPAAAADGRALDHSTQITDGVRLAYCQPYVQSFFNFLLVDHARLEGWQSGLLWADWTPKGSYRAFQRVIAEGNARSIDCDKVVEEASPMVDADPPAPPTQLTARPSGRGLKLDWADSEESDVMGYNVYRAATPEGPYTKVTAELAASSQYVDERSDGRHRDAYAVTAVDTAENEGRRSAPAHARPPTDER